MVNPQETDTKEYFLPFDDLGISKSQPFSSQIQIDFGAVSDIGKVRANNEDAFLIFRTGRYWQKMITNVSEQLLSERQEECAYTMAIADGMGGRAAGEVASSMVLATVVKLMLSSVKWALRLDQPDTRDQEIQEGIERAVDYLSKADMAIARHADADPSLEGMGTTLTASYSYADDLFLFHVGDSRAYLVRNKKLTQLTRDHTIAQALADLGNIRQDEVARHHYKHVLTRAVGRHAGKLEVEIHKLKLEDGDQLLLCSDGLTDLVPDDQISEVLNGTNPSQNKCQALVDLALQKGGKDNVTVLVAQYHIPPR
jgi:PPM family protein phosphatase